MDKQILNWQYDEFKQVGVDYENAAQVEKYDRDMAQLRDLLSEIDFMIRSIDLKKQDVVLEIGAGTGEFALGLAKRCARVVAADISCMMLNYAKKKAKKQKIDNIEFTHAGFLSIQSEEHFDAIVSQFAFHHLPDYWKMIALFNMFRLLKPDGRLFLKDTIFSFDMHRNDEVISAWIQGAQQQVGKEMADEIAMLTKEEYPTFDWVLTGMLERAGFTIDKVDYHSEFIASFHCIKL